MATTGMSGKPQVTPVWCEFDGTHIVFNTASGRVKDKSLAKNPMVALVAADPENPYRYVQIQGRATDAPIGRMTPKSSPRARRGWDSRAHE